MEINNNYQINFQGLKFKNNYCPSVEKEVKDILYKKLPKEEVDSFFSILIFAKGSISCLCISYLPPLLPGGKS